MTGKEPIFGVHFNTNENQIDIEEVKNEFKKYGNIIFVRQILQRVYVNFVTKEAAENCLSDSPNSKYGEIRRGKFGIPEAQNSKDVNSNQNSYRRTETYTFSKKTEIAERKINSSRISESDETTVMRNSRRSQADLGRESQTGFDSRFHASEKMSMSRESKHGISDGPPPLLSVDGPPPLLSVNERPSLQSFDKGPPPLISAVESHHPHPAKSFNGPKQRPPLLPTPPSFLTRYANPRDNNSHFSQVSSPVPSVNDGFGDLPPLISAVSQSVNENRECLSPLSYGDYVTKYGNYILIINIPEDITGSEVEKILYPHIPVCVSKPEVTNVRMKLLYCLVTFKSKTEATKAAKQLDGVEVRGQCLSMIRLDELILMSDVTF